MHRADASKMQVRGYNDLIWVWRADRLQETERQQGDGCVRTACTAACDTVCAIHVTPYVLLMYVLTTILHSKHALRSRTYNRAGRQGAFASKICAYVRALSTTHAPRHIRRAAHNNFTIAVSCKFLRSTNVAHDVSSYQLLVVMAWIMDHIYMDHGSYMHGWMPVKHWHTTAVNQYNQYIYGMLVVVWYVVSLY